MPWEFLGTSNDEVSVEEKAFWGRKISIYKHAFNLVERFYINNPHHRKD